MTEEKVHYRSCPLCEATCGLELTLRDDAVVRIRGDKQNTFSQGFICPKGSALHRLHDDPDRLRVPLIRTGDDPATSTWREVSWDEAFDYIQDRMGDIIATHGRDAIGVYMGNPSIHSLGPTIFNGPLIRAISSTNVFSASTVDQMPKHVSSGFLFGNPLAIPVPDLDHTNYLLMLGANPYESNGSLCTAPDFSGRMERIQQRGGKIVTVDPRNTKTAQHSDEWLPIRPGTDAYFLLALLHVVLRDGLGRTTHIHSTLSGLDEVKVAVQPFTPAMAAAVCGIDANTIERIANEFAVSDTAVAYGRIGTHTVRFGTLASWAVDALNIVTGNLDTTGGAMFPLAAHESGRGSGKGRGFTIGRRTSRVKGYPEVRGEFPVATLADEILQPGEGQIRAFLTVAGNPILSTPHSEQLQKAFAGLDFMVSVDPYLNETTRYADVILPPPSALERSDYHMAFFSLAVRNYAEWSPALFPASGPQEHEILCRLAMIFSGESHERHQEFADLLLHGAIQAAIGAPDSPLAQSSLDEILQILQSNPDRNTVDHIIDVMIRTGAYGDWFGAKPDGLSLDVLEANPHGVDLGALQPRLPKALRTQSGTIELFNDHLKADCAALQQASDEFLSHDLVLIGRRHLRSNNSWMHNINVLTKGQFRCTLQMHPDDAQANGVDNTSFVEVTSRVGSVVAELEITDEVTRGVVSLPHGWGHDLSGTRLANAQQRPGVNSNVLTDPELIDPLSGNAVLNGIPVTVRPATQPA